MAFVENRATARIITNVEEVSVKKTKKLGKKMLATSFKKRVLAFVSKNQKNLVVFYEWTLIKSNLIGQMMLV